MRKKKQKKNLNVLERLIVYSPMQRKKILMIDLEKKLSKEECQMVFHLEMQMTFFVCFSSKKEDFLLTICLETSQILEDLQFQKHFLLILVQRLTIEHIHPLILNPE